MKEAKEDVEVVKASLARSEEEIQQWVCDVKQWARQGAIYFMLYQFNFNIRSQFICFSL